MMKFNEFLTENAAEEKLKHLEHPEDHIIHAGQAGLHHALRTLYHTHRALQGKKSEAKINTKVDGSPSIIFGHHPETKKFFVASKSAFNKNPKINHTPEDVDKNHGDKPGLAHRLKTALKHLPKVTPEHGVYQGDIMYTKKDVAKHGEHVAVTPNTITYKAHKDSETGKAMQKAHIGVAVHTKYEGSSLNHMKAQYNHKPDDFKKHPHVHIIDTSI